MIDAPPRITAFGFVTSYERKGFYSPAEIAPHVGAPEQVDFDGDLIDMGSARYRLFAKDPTCEYCGLEGTLYAKERAARFSKATETYHPTTNKWHFNLYALDQQGRLVLMTKDHVIPKSRGGVDADENYVTACQPCNMRKSNRMPGESDRDFYKVRRPESNDPRNRAQRAADRRNKRAIVKEIQRADAAGGQRVTHVAWGGYTGDEVKAEGSEPMRAVYVRKCLVFGSETPRTARLFHSDGVSNQHEFLTKGRWADTGAEDEVKATQAVGFAHEPAARAYLKGLNEAADALEAAKLEARIEEARRHNAWVKAQAAECADCVAKRARTGVRPWGLVVGACDIVGLTSHDLIEVKKWLVFTGGCNGAGSLFETDEIVSATMHTVTGWWRFSDLGKVLGPKHAHNANHALAGFDTKVEAMDFIQTLLDAALHKDAA